VAGLEANTLADGFFHVATWVFVATASYLSVRAWERRELAPPWRAHFGLLLAGWGTFNALSRGSSTISCSGFITSVMTSTGRWRGTSASLG
jgi:uncharacterized membrane protein